MQKVFNVILSFIFFLSLTLSNANAKSIEKNVDVNVVKKKILLKLNRRIENLENAKLCVTNSTTIQDIKSCRPKKK